MRNASDHRALPTQVGHRDNARCVLPYHSRLERGKVRDHEAHQQPADEQYREELEQGKSRTTRFATRIHFQIPSPSYQLPTSALAPSPPG
jgi:hypothetical protein